MNYFSVKDYVSAIAEIKKLSWAQRTELAGYAIVAGAAGYEAHGYLGAAGAAIAAIGIHLRGLVQPPPFGKAAAAAAAAKSAAIIRPEKTANVQSDTDIFGAHSQCRHRRRMLSRAGRGEGRRGLRAARAIRVRESRAGAGFASRIRNSVSRIRAVPGPGGSRCHVRRNKGAGERHVVHARFLPRANQRVSG